VEVCAQRMLTTGRPSGPSRPRLVFGRVARRPSRAMEGAALKITTSRESTWMRPVMKFGPRPLLATRWLGEQRFKTGGSSGFGQNLRHCSGRDFTWRKSRAWGT